MSEGKTLVAQLPSMKNADLQRFEREGGIWGQQRAIRRQQLTVAGASTLLSSVGGWYWAVARRGNTSLVGICTLPVFAMFGAAVGNAFGTSLYPSVADNSEVTLMRRTWWAKECSKTWDMSQVSDGVWKAKYPNLDVSRLSQQHAK
jgi:hypothetical protein